MTDLPEPFTPADCNLRGMPFMPLDTERLLDSDMMALSTGEEFKTALRLWCKSWNQEPAASLPDDDRILAHLAGKELSSWRRMRDMALRGFVKCSDGRLYHPVIAEKAIEAMRRRDEYLAKKEGENDRKREEREDRRMLFAALRDIGVILQAKGTPTAHLRKVAASHGIRIVVTEGHKVVTVTSQGSHKESHADVTAKTGTGTGTGTDKAAATRTRARAPAREAAAAAPLGESKNPKTDPQADPPPDPLHTRAVEITVMLRQRGASLQASDPRLRRWAETDVTDAQVLAALEIAQQRRENAASTTPINAGYLDSILTDVRAAGPPGTTSAGNRRDRYAKDAEQIQAMARWADEQLRQGNADAQFPRIEG